MLPATEAEAAAAEGVADGVEATNAAVAAVAAPEVVERAADKPGGAHGGRWTDRAEEEEGSQTEDGRAGGQVQTQGKPTPLLIG